MKKELNLYHFFPEKLNLYGDRGNVTILKKRCEWRGIELKINEIKDANEVNFNQTDIFFIGGGSDREQSLCTEVLLGIKEEFKKAIEDGICGLTICGGYQFLGDYYETAKGEKLKGLGILDYYSKAFSDKEKQRLIGDLHVLSKQFGRIVGYENHSGETFHNYETLGKVVSGYGNNKKDKKEGLLYKNLIGTYLHGPILSKNPKIADWMISKALKRKYGNGDLEELVDNFEEEANDQIWSRCFS